MNEKENFLKKTKENTKESYQKAKEIVKEGKEKSDEIRHSSVWQKTKEGSRKAAKIVGSHLAAIKTSITFSNEEAELIENLKDKLNKKGFYPSKSEILRAGLWSLRNKNEEELKKTIEDLFKVKQTRIF